MSTLAWVQEACLIDGESVSCSTMEFLILFSWVGCFQQNKCSGTDFVKMGTHLHSLHSLTYSTYARFASDVLINEGTNH